MRTAGDHKGSICKILDERIIPTQCTRAGELRVSVHELGGAPDLRGRAFALHRCCVERGDALIFPSLKSHNVTPITSGMRFTLVVELWKGAENREGRYA